MSVDLTFTVNGESRTVPIADSLRRLLDVLRDDLRLTGSKEGCGEGECGACSVLMDGRLVNSCLIPALQAEGTEILTVEGIAATKRGGVIIEAFAEMHAPQCGFCTPGITVAAEALLRENPDPDEGAIREFLTGNICRCTGYDMIVDGVIRAAEKGRGLW